MSKKSSHNQNTPDPDAAKVEESAESKAADVEESPIESVEAELDEEGFAEEEFSLDQLSQAYAEVLKSREGETEQSSDADDDPLPTEDADPSPHGTIDESPDAEFDDNAACPISPESIIESILFVGAPKDVKLNSRKVAAVLRDVSPKEVTRIVRELNAKYEKEDTAYRIKSDGGVFQMMLDPKLLDFQQEFFGRNRQVRLSQAAIDVMAIVAYNQPATRDQVEKIRARPSGAVLSQLVRRQLLFVEPGETNPKIRYYSTTDRFLDLFSLEEIADLPQSHDVSDIEELAD